MDVKKSELKRIKYVIVMNWQRNKSYMILQSIHTERIGGPFQAVFAPESYYNFDNTSRLVTIPHRDIRLLWMGRSTLACMWWNSNFICSGTF